MPVPRGWPPDGPPWPDEGARELQGALCGLRDALRGRAAIIEAARLTGADAAKRLSDLAQRYARTIQSTGMKVE